jgi:hypothetical protein
VAIPGVALNRGQKEVRLAIAQSGRDEYVFESDLLGELNMYRDIEQDYAARHPEWLGLRTLYSSQEVIRSIVQ